MDATALTPTLEQGMPRVTYVQHDGTASEQDVDSGWSVMEGAVNNGVPGIDADCGGACACATCHVFVAPDWLARLDPAGEQESGMLEFVENRAQNSRLSCQIAMTDALDGLVVTLPEHQY